MTLLWQWKIAAFSRSFSLRNLLDAPQKIKNHPRFPLMFITGRPVAIFGIQTQTHSAAPGSGLDTGLFFQQGNSSAVGPIQVFCEAQSR